jgi:tetratricopeptide (TPR) repeat protein
LTFVARGKVEAGLAVAAEGLPRLRASNNHVHMALLQCFWALAHLLVGDSQRALEIARAGIASAQESRSQLYVYWGLALQAWAESRLGQHLTALQDFGRAQALERELGSPLLLSDWFAAAEAELALNRGALKDALALAEHAAAGARSMDQIFAEALAERVWGQALCALEPHHFEQAESHFARSLELFQESDARLEAARTRVAWGDVLREQGKNDSARTLYAQASAQFQVSGLGAESDLVQQKMREVFA